MEKRNKLTADEARKLYKEFKIEDVVDDLMPRIYKHIRKKAMNHNKYCFVSIPEGLDNDTILDVFDLIIKILNSDGYACELMQDDDKVIKLFIYWA